MMALFSYAQVRCLYDAGQFWEPEIADAMPAVASLATAAAGPASVAVGG